jgi:hypothetical protein
MSLHDFLLSAKQGQIVWFVVPGFLIRGSFAKADPGLEFVNLSQVAIFQGAQATGSVPTMMVAVSAINAWG